MASFLARPALQHPFSHRPVLLVLRHKFETHAPLTVLDEDVSIEPCKELHSIFTVQICSVERASHRTCRLERRISLPSSMSAQTHLDGIRRPPTWDFACFMGLRVLQAQCPSPAFVEIPLQQVAFSLVWQRELSCLAGSDVRQALSRSALALYRGGCSCLLHGTWGLLRVGAAMSDKGIHDL